MPEKFGTDLILEEIHRERQRQVVIEGFGREHDDLYHNSGQLAAAAGCYALNAGTAQKFRDALGANGMEDALRRAPPGPAWPWDREWWKPKNLRRDLVRAAALIVAEIERLDRARDRGVG